MKYKYDEFNHNEFESHRLALNLIEPGSKVLDLGCATGYMARELLKKDCITWGVDGDHEALKKASQYCQKVIQCNFNDCRSLAVPKKYFDYILILDVIEHLVQPEKIIAIVKLHLKEGGRIIISVPNSAHALVRWMVLKGDFEYTSTGMMDKTHVHFYTKKSFEYFLKKMKLKVIDLVPTNGMCQVPLLYKITDRLPSSWQYRITRLAPTLFSYQFIAVAKLAN